MLSLYQVGFPSNISNEFKMNRISIFPLIAIAVILIISCKLFEKEEPKPIEVYGCMDSTATN